MVFHLITFLKSDKMTKMKHSTKSKNDGDEKYIKEETESKCGSIAVGENKLRGKGQQQQRWTAYDIWECQAEEVNATKQRRRGKRVKYVPNLLPAVVPPPEGMSYNPPVDSYLRMVEQVAKEEQKIEKSQRRTERRIGIDIAEAMALPALREEVRFSVRGVTVKRDDDGVKEEAAGGGDREEGTKANAKEFRAKKPKTAKEKKRRKLRKEEEKRQTMAKKVEGKMRRQLDSLKSLKSEVVKETEAYEKRNILKKRQRALKALTRRKRLGRGKFEPFEEPILGVDELCPNLRQLSPQGNVLEERLKSFQRRNILPIAGDRQQNILKARLKFKLVEKRSVKEVNEDSRVI